MPIANTADNYMVGTQQVERIYQGANIVWENAQFLLDEFPNAAVAYSLRLLRSDYTGAAIRVRRGSDNAEQDIGFVSGALDTAALTAFVGASDGWIKTWYDQSGLGLNAFSGSPTVDPLIISSGVIQTIGGIPCIFFYDDSSASLDHLNVPLYHTAAQSYVANFFAGGTQSAGFFPYFMGTSNGDRGFELGLDASTRSLRPITIRTGGASQYFGSSLNIGQLYILGTTANRSTLAGYINGTLNVSGADRNENFNMPGLYRLGNSSTAAIQGQIAISEFVAYTRDVGSEIAGIHANMNNYYNAY